MKLSEWSAFEVLGHSEPLVVPLYQRRYDWGVKQCRRLLHDLREIIVTNKKGNHFFGTILVVRTQLAEREIIDGQQRITTVSLLLRALCDAAREGEADLSETETKKIENTYLINRSDPDNPTFRLHTNPRNQAAYEALFSGTAERVTNSNITRNYDYFRKVIRDGYMKASEVYESIRHLSLINIELFAEDDPQSVFECINSTGIALKESDKIRNTVLMGLTRKDQQFVYEKCWTVLENTYPNSLDDFFYDYVTARLGRYVNKKNLHEEFCEYQKLSRLAPRELMEEVKQYCFLRERLFHAQTSSPLVSKELQRCMMVDRGVIVPFFLELLRDFDGGKIEEQEFASIIRIIDSYFMRRLVIGTMSAGANKLFPTMYRELWKETNRIMATGEERPPMDQLLAINLFNRTGKSQFPSDAVFAENFGKTKMYQPSLQGFHAYLFNTLENKESKDKIDVAGLLDKNELSVEHIMPQKLTPAWKKELGEDAERIHNLWLHRIGNLTVTGYNSKYSNKSFTEKLEGDAENGLCHSPYRLNSLVKTCDHWDEQAIIERTAKLTEDALCCWPAPVITYTPPADVSGTRSTSLADEEELTGTKLKAYEFKGETLEVAGWARMFVDVFTALFDEYPSEMMDLAAANMAGLCETSDLFEKHPDWFEKISGGPYLITHNSTRAKIDCLNELFDNLELDKEMLVFHVDTGKQGSETGKSPEKLDPSVEILNDWYRENASLDWGKNEILTFCNLIERLNDAPADDVKLDQESYQLLHQSIGTDLLNKETLVRGLRYLVSQDRKMLAIDMPSLVDRDKKQGNLEAWLKRLVELSVLQET